MARRTAPPEPRSADLSLQHMQGAIPQLTRRLEQLQEFDFQSLTKRYDPELDALQQKLDTTLDEIFGPDTIERNRFRVMLDSGPIIIGGASFREVMKGYEEGFAGAIQTFKTIIELFTEKLEDAERGKAVPSLRSVETLNLHPAVANAAVQKYKDGHYADAIETACKVLNNLVQIASGLLDLDGDDLMRQAFSANKPVLRFNDLTDKTDISEQRGMMELYAGAIGAFRNPRAHKLVNDDPGFALEVIAFISFLAKALDKTTK